MSLIIGYLFIIYVLPRLVVPYYGFTKTKLPTKLPADWQVVVDDLKKTSKTQEAYLRNAFNYMTDHYVGGRFETFRYFFYMFENPFVHKGGFLQCHLQNYLLRTLLVKGGMFEEKDIEVHTEFLNFFTHQYLRVKVGDKWITIDPHTYSLGVPFGEKAFLFA